MLHQQKRQYRENISTAYHNTPYFFYVFAGSHSSVRCVIFRVLFCWLNGRSCCCAVLCVSSVEVIELITGCVLSTYSNIVPVPT